MSDKQTKDDESDEIERLRRELEELKKSYAELLQQKKFVNIFDQPPTLFQVIKERHGKILMCKLCKTKGGTVSLTHNSSCRYDGTQVWYSSSETYGMKIYDVAMFNSFRRS